MLDKKPYLVRAIYEWISDNDWTPYILVDTDINRCDVPSQYINDGHIVLNISHSAVQNLVIANDTIRFDARFSGKQSVILLPMASLVSIYARENSEGLSFTPIKLELGSQKLEPVSAEPADKPKPRLSIVPKD